MGARWGRMDTRVRAAAGALGPLSLLLPVGRPQPRAPEQLTALLGVAPGRGRNPAQACPRNCESAAPWLPGCQRATRTAKMGVAETETVVRGRGLEWGVAWVPTGPQLGGKRKPVWRSFRKGKGGGSPAQLGWRHLQPPITSPSSSAGE